MTARPKVVVLDYGSGNLRSAQRALARVGADVTVSADPGHANDADGLVIPGVGSFAGCMRGLRNLSAQQLVDRRLAGGRPILGVCIGMQVMFTDSEESPGVMGLDQWPGTVRRLSAQVLPHTGWTSVRSDIDSRLFHGLTGERFYFVHSFAATSWDMREDPRRPKATLAWAQHGEPFIAAIEQGPLSATQFHPEKSGDVGLGLLRNWVNTLR